MPEKVDDLINSLSALVGESNISAPEVIENGQRVSSPRIDPSVMNFIMLASIASQVVKIRKYFDDRIPKGNVWPYSVPVTDVVQEIIPPVPGQCAAIINHGRNSIFVGVNKMRMLAHEMLPSETYHIDLETHSLKCLHLWCAAGLTSSAEIAISE